MELSSLIESLKWRYATKQFDAGRQLDEGLVSQLLEATRLSASSFGLQPWKFFVVTHPETRQKLRPHSWNQPQITDASHLVVLATRKSIDNEFISQYVREISVARGATVESLKGYEEMMRGFIENLSEERKQDWAARQIYIALGTLLTACAVARIDACPMEGFDPTAYDSILGLDERGYSAKVLCPIGHRSIADPYAKSPKTRREQSQVIEFIS